MKCHTFPQWQSPATTSVVLAEGSVVLTVGSVVLTVGGWPKLLDDGAATVR